MEEKREKVKNDFEAKKRMPQGIVQNAIETIREDLGKDEQFASYHLDKKVAAREENPISNIEIWKDVVRDNFESAWRTAKETHDDTDIVGDAGDDGAGDSEEEDDGENDELTGSKAIRTCTTTLKKILRPGVAIDHFADFVSIAEDHQKVFTDIMSEVSILSMKAVHMVSKTIMS